MSKTSNNFIKGRMNQDLDDRLIPSGEYRKATNVTISKSEGEDVGSVQTVLGNSLIADFGYTEEVKIIGVLSDENNSILYLFFSDFNDNSVDNLSGYSTNATNAIWSYDISTNTSKKLVEGAWLNFSTTHNILSIDLLENLLFWTDNRNQPRKINVDLANPSNLPNPTYYFNEDQISVAKYYPFKTIELIQNTVIDVKVTDSGSNIEDFKSQVFPTSNITGDGCGLILEASGPYLPNGGTNHWQIVDPGQGYFNGDIVEIELNGLGTNPVFTIETLTESTMTDKCTEFLPETIEYERSGGTLVVGPTTNIPVVPALSNEWLYTLVKIIDQNGVDKTPVPGATRINQTGNNIEIFWDVTLGPATFNYDNGDKIIIGVNPYYDSEWPGDCTFLRDKFVRFAYRFEFDDGEYSLISPFTQACFVPFQDGYILEGDEDKAIDSTELLMFYNKINNIKLLIPSPTYLNDESGWDKAVEQMHIAKVQIIYKDDAETNLKLVHEIDLQAESVICDQKYLIYDYQSVKPYRVLPEREITRVSDIVPIRAKTQSIAGNRVIYGNFINKHTAPSDLNYQVNASEKFNNEQENFKRVEYQNHNLKQNRTYQLGWVLSDRYGRQSDVVLSSLDNTTNTASGVEFGGSTFTHEYKNSSFNASLITPNDTWPGDNIKVIFNQAIPSTIGEQGYPGLFVSAAEKQIRDFFVGEGYGTLGTVVTGVAVGGGSGVGMEVDYVAGTPGNPFLSSITDLTITNLGSGYVNGDLITIPSGSATKIATFRFYNTFVPNLLGWYTMKAVVKQNETDYYNVFLPSVLNGEVKLNPNLGTVENRSNITIFGDNINKVPKDLQFVSNDQNLFTSNVSLNFRVSNTNVSPYNEQYDIFNTSTQTANTDTVVSLGTMTDLKIASADSVQIPVKNAVAAGTTVELDVVDNTLFDKVAIGNNVTGIDAAGAYIAGLGPLDNVTIKSRSMTTTETTLVLMDGNGAPVAVTTAVGETININPPTFIYNASQNPIIGILNTAKDIGVKYNDGFEQSLTVAETLPVNSNLEIYWETSTAVSIPDLNLLINSATEEIALIEPVNVSWEEKAAPFTQISNTFKPTLANGIPVSDPFATGNITSVVNGLGVSNNSLINIVNDGTGGFYLENTQSIACYGNPATYNFTVEGTITQDSITVPFTTSFAVLNSQPFCIEIDGNSGPSGSGSGVGYNTPAQRPQAELDALGIDAELNIYKGNDINFLYPFYFPGGSQGFFTWFQAQFSNGAHPSTPDRHKGLEFEVISLVPATDGVFAVFDGSTGPGANYVDATPGGNWDNGPLSGIFPDSMSAYEKLTRAVDENYFSTEYNATPYNSPNTEWVQGCPSPPPPLGPTFDWEAQIKDNSFIGGTFQACTAPSDFYSNCNDLVTNTDYYKSGPLGYYRDGSATNTAELGQKMGLCPTSGTNPGANTWLVPDSYLTKQIDNSQGKMELFANVLTGTPFGNYACNTGNIYAVYLAFLPLDFTFQIKDDPGSIKQYTYRLYLCEGCGNNSGANAFNAFYPTRTCNQFPNNYIPYTP